MFRKALIISFMSISGCSTINYIEPTEGPLAKVRFSTDFEDIVVLWGYKDSNCNGESEWMRLKNGYLMNSSPKSLDIPLSEDLHKNAYKEFLLPSNVEHVFMFKSAYLSGTAEYSCAVPVKMKFNKDEMYEVSYQHTGLTCTAEVSRIHKTSEGKIRREAVKVFNNYTYGFGEKCKEAFEKSRLY
ncbi:hypothetical protein PVK63_01255 [Aliivibrio sp. S2TY2]|uniref:hypothetical protein n=1 Tax=unclassified Aliivibrio TaxID=2645654 RepID=UPI00237965F7|nr:MULTISPECIES: hypothetical protein [unclassified Aliivibrio]MDD9173482.1 hypothetical protein [Aliivibrio sp. S3TY1]MDD9190558.1 hypothetical protein [Aliivibrio sp. S2TY2]